jgi:hypothetical protein
VPPLVDLLPIYRHTYIPPDRPVCREPGSLTRPTCPPFAGLLPDKMHDSPESGHSEPPSLEKDDYVSEAEKTVEVNVDELEPVVTPKTWVVVGVRSHPPSPICLVLTVRVDIVYGLWPVILAHSRHGRN